MFWLVTLSVMVVMAIALQGVADLIEQEEMEEEYETAYVIIYR